MAAELGDQVGGGLHEGTVAAHTLAIWSVERVLEAYPRVVAVADRVVDQHPCGLTVAMLQTRRALIKSVERLVDAAHQRHSVCGADFDGLDQDASQLTSQVKPTERYGVLDCPDSGLHADAYLQECVHNALCSGLRDVDRRVIGTFPRPDQLQPPRQVWFDPCACGDPHLDAACRAHLLDHRIDRRGIPSLNAVLISGMKMDRTRAGGNARPSVHRKLRGRYREPRMISPTEISVQCRL